MSWTDRRVRSGVERAGALLANPLNWRVHPDEQLAALRGGLEQLGWLRPVLVNETTGLMVDGHARALLALEDGEDTQVPVDYVQLTEAEERAALASLDPITTMATANAARLHKLLEAIGEPPPGLELLFDSLRADFPKPRGTGQWTPRDPETAPDPSDVEARSQPGDLWTMGGHLLACGDSTDPTRWAELFATRPTWACMLTDPPYGVDYDGGPRQERERRIQGDARDDYQEWFGSWLELAAERADPEANTAYLFMGDREMPALAYALRDGGWHRSSMLLWLKDRPVLGRMDYNQMHESICYAWYGRHRFHGGYGQATVAFDERAELDEMSAADLRALVAHYRDLVRTSVLEHPKPQRSELHPTMKPVELLVRLLEHGTLPGAVVVDPFGGSGSTLIACEQTGRRCRTIELDRAFADVIVKRWQEVTGEAAVRHDGVTFDDVPALPLREDPDD